MNDTTHYFDVYDGDPVGRACRRMVIEDGDGVECGLPRWHPVHRIFAKSPDIEALIECEACDGSGLVYRDNPERSGYLLAEVCGACLGSGEIERAGK